MCGIEFPTVTMTRTKDFVFYPFDHTTTYISDATQSTKFKKDRVLYIAWSVFSLCVFFHSNAGKHM